MAQYREVLAQVLLDPDRQAAARQFDVLNGLLRPLPVRGPRPDAQEGQAPAHCVGGQLAHCPSDPLTSWKVSGKYATRGHRPATGLYSGNVYTSSLDCGMAHSSAGRMRRWLSMWNFEVTARRVIGGLALHIVWSDRPCPSSQRRETRWVQ